MVIECKSRGILGEPRKEAGIKELKARQAGKRVLRKCIFGGNSEQRERKQCHLLLEAATAGDAQPQMFPKKPCVWGLGRIKGGDFGKDP